MQTIVTAHVDRYKVCAEAKAIRQSPANTMVELQTRALRYLNAVLDKTDADNDWKTANQKKSDDVDAILGSNVALMMTLMSKCVNAIPDPRSATPERLTLAFEDFVTSVRNREYDQIITMKMGDLVKQMRPKLDLMQAYPRIYHLLDAQLSYTTEDKRHKYLPYFTRAMGLKGYLKSILEIFLCPDIMMGQKIQPVFMMTCELFFNPILEHVQNVREVCCKLALKMLAFVDVNITWVARKKRSTAAAAAAASSEDVVEVEAVEDASDDVKSSKERNSYESLQSRLQFMIDGAHYDIFHRAEPKDSARPAAKRQRVSATTSSANEESASVMTFLSVADLNLAREIESQLGSDVLQEGGHDEAPRSGYDDSIQGMFTNQGQSQPPLPQSSSSSVELGLDDAAEFFGTDSSQRTDDAFRVKMDSLNAILGTTTTNQNTYVNHVQREVPPPSQRGGLDWFATDEEMEKGVHTSSTARLDSYGQWESSTPNAYRN